MSRAKKLAVDVADLTALVARLEAELQGTEGTIKMLRDLLIRETNVNLTLLNDSDAKDATIKRLTAEVAALRDGFARSVDSVIEIATPFTTEYVMELDAAYQSELDRRTPANVPDVSEIPWDVQTAFERRAL